MLFLVIQEDGREGFAGIQLHLILPSVSDTVLPVPFVDDSTEEEEQDADCVFCTVPVVPLKTTMEKSGYDVRNISDGRTHCVLVWRKILFVKLVGNKQCFVLILYPLYLYLFKFCKYSLRFLCKLFTSPN